MTRYRHTSVTRISDLAQRPFEVAPLARSLWATGDYVVGEVLDTSGNLHGIELPNGRMIEAIEGDLVLGALGSRAATLEAVGEWQSIEADRFEALTPAGLFGKLTSRSPFLSPLMPLEYRGHVQRDRAKVTMSGCVGPTPEMGRLPPVVLITGTSMSSGKTLSGRLIVHLLKQRGLRVVGAKLTGAARYRDVLSFGDAGADEIFDFVDAGLPSTVCHPDLFRVALEGLLGRIAAAAPDVVVAEAGASPLEPYNGATLMAEVGEQVRCTVLCASDPYAVVGVVQGFGIVPDLVAGIATNTTAGIELIHKLTGREALNVHDRSSHARLEGIVTGALEGGDTRG
jgi:hypothetical protein